MLCRRGQVVPFILVNPFGSQNELLATSPTLYEMPIYRISVLMVSVHPLTEPSQL